MFTVWKLREISITKNYFRQINFLVTYIVKPLLSRNLYQKCVRENSRNFHTDGNNCEIWYCNFICIWSDRKFREIEYYNLICIWIDEKFVKIDKDRCKYVNATLYILNQKFVKIKPKTVISKRFGLGKSLWFTVSD